MAQRRGKAYMAWVRSHRRTNRPHRKHHHAKRRHNPFPIGGLAVNPRRNPSPARRYQRNPKIMGIEIPPIQPILYVGAGFAGTVALEHVLTTGTAPIIPLTVTSTTLGKYAVRVGCVIALGFLAKATLGKEKAKLVAIGGGSYVLISAVKEFAPTAIPGLSAYTPLRNTGMGAYRQLAAAPQGGNFGRQLAAAQPSASQGRFNRF